MRRTVSFVVMVLLGTVFCSLVASQQGQRSIATNGSSTQGVSKNRETSARMISGSNNGNKIHTSQYDDNSDSAHDNGPAGRDSSEITFPNEDFYPPPEPIPTPTGSRSPPATVQPSGNSTTDSKWKQIPLNALVKFGTQSNLAEFFRTYVKNTKVVQDSDTQDEYLADSEGNPILDAKREKVVVSTANVGMQTPLLPSVRTINSSNRGRGAVIETKTKLDVESMTHVGRASKSMSLPVCSPEITTVPVPLKVEPNMLIIPKCLRVERCGGCCFSDLTVCEPEATEMLEFSITKLGYDGDNDGNNPRLQLVNSTVVEVERHTKCRCNCKVKAEHCRSHHHRYEANQCSCMCKNTEEHQKCLDSPDNRIWDNETCQCTCKESKICSSGFRFDYNSCNCEREVEIPSRRISRLPLHQQRGKKL